MRTLVPLVTLSAHAQLTLVFCGAAPHSVHLARGQRKLQALAAHPAPGTDFLRPGNLVPARPVRRDRKEKLRVCL